MTDSTSDDGRDDFILQERLSGRSARSIGKQLSLTVSEVNASLDRTLPKIDNELKMRYVALDLMRLDELISVFAKRAIEQEDVPAGMLVIKALERRSALLGTDAPTKFDVISVQAQQQPTNYEKIREAVFRIAGRPVPPPLANGNGERPNGGAGAVDTLSPPDDDKPSP